MLTNISDARGRALEYCIVDKLSKSKDDVNLLGDTARNQDRDESKFHHLDDRYKDLYVKSTDNILKWLDVNFNYTNKKLSVYRLADSAATKGDVTDIQLIIDSKKINLSIKHNHDALKHQRPATTAQRCGFAKGSKEDIEFRDKLEKIYTQYLNHAKKLDPHAKLFSDIKKIDSNFINANVYKPVCHLVVQTIEKLCRTPVNTLSLFDFLVGTTDFYKLRVGFDGVKIYKFTDIVKPHDLLVSTKGYNYVILKFSNGWEISMRLHTASSRIGTSLKFDTQALNLDKYIPVEIISN